MPAEIRDYKDYVLVRYHGVVTAKDLQSIAAQAECLERALPTRSYRIADLTGVERFDFGFDPVHELAERRRLCARGANVSAVLVAANPVQYGFARMFQMLIEDEDVESCVVASMDDALAWLAQCESSTTAATHLSVPSGP